jgi:hypothetical protein
MFNILLQDEPARVQCLPCETLDEMYPKVSNALWVHVSHEFNVLRILVCLNLNLNLFFLPCGYAPPPTFIFGSSVCIIVDGVGSFFDHCFVATMEGQLPRQPHMLLRSFDAFVIISDNPKSVL